jgi:hypothetical protein
LRRELVRLDGFTFNCRSDSFPDSTSNQDLIHKSTSPPPFPAISSAKSSDVVEINKIKLESRVSDASAMYPLKPSMMNVAGMLGYLKIENVRKAGK